MSQYTYLTVIIFRLVDINLSFLNIYISYHFTLSTQCAIDQHELFSTYTYIHIYTGDNVENFHRCSSVTSEGSRIHFGQGSQPDPLPSCSLRSQLQHRSLNLNILLIVTANVLCRNRVFRISLGKISSSAESILFKFNAYLRYTYRYRP